MKTLSELKNWQEAIDVPVVGEALEFLKLLPDKSIDLLVTDPPYNYKMNGGGSLGKKYDGYKEKVNKLGYVNAVEFLNLVKPKLKIFNAYVWCGKELLLEIAGWAKQNKLNWNILIWYKPNPMPAYNNTYLPDLEYCVFMRESGALFVGGLGYEKYRKCFNYPIGDTGFEHPTVKPLKIMYSHIEISSNKNDLILDPFLGSGTTAVASKKLGRHFLGCDLNPDYVKICNQRLAQQMLEF